MRAFAVGFIAALLLGAAAAFAVVTFGLIPSSADSKPARLERWAANRALHATMARDAAGLTDPLPVTEANLSAGLKLYSTNCVFCHGASDARRSNAARGFYIGAPQLADDGVEDDPEAISYWKIAHGIRFTAMPAFGKSLTATQIWQIAQFVAHMDKLPPAVQTGWKNVPSAGPQP